MARLSLVRPVNPYAQIFPLMEGAEFDALCKDIEANGLRHPITLLDNSILDGRNRERACKRVGVPTRTEQYTGKDPLGYVLSANLHRRHLNESQRAMVAAKVAAWRLGQNQHTGGSANLPTQAEAAHLLNVSPRSVRSAVEVCRSAIPAIVSAVEQGAVPVSKAVLVARLPKERQHHVASQLGNGKSASTIVFAATRADRADRIERASLAVPLSTLGRRFPVLYADPPWQFEQWSEGGMLKAAEMHYPTMPTAEIAAKPVADIAARDAVLFMWAVSAMMPDALQVVAAWGFTFKTFAVWVKPHIGCGHWFRGQHEPLIVATRGDFPPPPELRGSVFTGTALRQHSTKPVEVRDWIAATYPQAGKLELFCRGTAGPGWTAWGFEAQAAA